MTRLLGCQPECYQPRTARRLVSGHWSRRAPTYLSPALTSPVSTASSFISPRPPPTFYFWHFISSVCGLLCSPNSFVFVGVSRITGMLWWLDEAVGCVNYCLPSWVGWWLLVPSLAHVYDGFVCARRWNLSYQLLSKTLLYSSFLPAHIYFGNRTSAITSVWKLFQIKNVRRMLRNVCVGFPLYLIASDAVPPFEIQALKTLVHL